MQSGSAQPRWRGAPEKSPGPERGRHGLDATELEHIAALDDVFPHDVLHAADVRLEGVVEEADLATLQSSVKRLLGLTSVEYGLALLMLLNVTVMLTSPDGSAAWWVSVADVISAACFGVWLLELLLYCFAFGVTVRFGDSAAQGDKERTVAVLSLWAPPRVRQALHMLHETKAQHSSQAPLLGNPVMLMAAVVLLVSFIGYVIPADDVWSRMRNLHGLLALRLLTTLGRVFPQIDHLTFTLRQSFRMIATATAFFAFFIVVFTVLGLDPFKGDVRFRCVRLDPYTAVVSNATSPTSVDEYYDGLCRGEAGELPCVDVRPRVACSTSSSASFMDPYVCPRPQVCREGQAPNRGYTSFDDFFYTALSVVHITSLSEWTPLWYALWAGNPRIAVLGYCLVLVVTISYIMLNLVTAIISSSYVKMQGQSRNRVARPSKLRRLVLVRAVLDLYDMAFADCLTKPLTYEVENAAGVRDKHVPFFKKIQAAVLIDLVLFGVMVANAFHTANSSASFVSALNLLERIYVAVFGMETILSVVACRSFSKYVATRLRQFDLLCLVLAIAGLIAGRRLSVVRALRIARWTRGVEFIDGLFRQMGRAIAPSAAVTTVLFVAVYVFAAISVKLYSEGCSEYFGRAFDAFLVMIRFVTVDGWQRPMYSAMANVDPFLGVAFSLVMYFVFGYLIVSLYIAVIVEAFQPTHDERLQLQQDEFRADTARTVMSEEHVQQQAVASMLQADDDRTSSSKASYQIKLATAIARGATTREEGPEGDKADEPGHEPVASPGRERAFEDNSLWCLGLHNPLRRALIRLAVEVDETQRPELAPLAYTNAASPHLRKVEQDKQKEVAAKFAPPETYGAYFNLFVMVIVALSCVSIFFDKAPEACDDGESSTSKVLTTLFLVTDVLFVLFFAAEAGIRVMALGAFTVAEGRPWWLGPPYFRDPWNLLDFLLLLSMLLGFAVPQARPLRMLRMLRPLRFIRRMRHLRHVITGMVSALPSILVLLTLSAYFLFVLGIVGVDILAGKLGYCSEAVIGGIVVTQRSQCHGVAIDPATGFVRPVSWERRAAHLDDAVAAMRYLTELSSLAGLQSRMAEVFSVVGVDRQPKPGASEQYVVFFVVMVIAMGIVGMNLVVGIVMFHFNAHRGVLLLTVPQRDWFTVRSDIRNLERIQQPPATSCPDLLAFVENAYFKRFINVAVVLNVAVLASTHYNQPDQWTTAQFWLNVVFLLVFIVEMVMKLVAFRLDYFRDPWNHLDCLVVVSAVVEFAVDMSSGGSGVAVLSVARSFRILRVFRSAKRVPSLRHMFHTLALSLVPILSLVGILVIFLMIFAVLGMNFFGQVRFLRTYHHDANFRSPFMSAALMFRLLTLDGWTDIMHDLRLYAPPFCNNNQPGWVVRDADGDPVTCKVLNDCSSASSQFFFIGFFLLTAYLVLSVVVAILLENFNYISTQTRISIKMQHLQGYREAWLKAHQDRPPPHNVAEHYEDTIVPEMLPALITRLFDEGNTLAANPDGLSIHPTLSADARFNYRRLHFEIRTLGEHAGLEYADRFTFHNILLACARLQFGLSCLTLVQREQRAIFENMCASALVRDRVQRLLTPLLCRAEETVRAGPKKPSSFHPPPAAVSVPQGPEPQPGLLRMQPGIPGGKTVVSGLPRNPSCSSADAPALDETLRTPGPVRAPEPATPEPVAEDPAMPDPAIVIAAADAFDDAVWTAEEEARAFLALQQRMHLEHEAATRLALCRPFVEALERVLRGEVASTEAYLRRRMKQQRDSVAWPPPPRLPSAIAAPTPGGAFQPVPAVAAITHPSASVAAPLSRRTAPERPAPIRVAEPLSPVRAAFEEVVLLDADDDEEEEELIIGAGFVAPEHTPGRPGVAALPTARGSVREGNPIVRSFAPAAPMLPGPTSPAVSSVDPSSFAGPLPTMPWTHGPPAHTPSTFTVPSVPNRGQIKAPRGTGAFTPPALHLGDRTVNPVASLPAIRTSAFAPGPPPEPPRTTTRAPGHGASTSAPAVEVVTIDVDE